MILIIKILIKNLIYIVMSLNSYNLPILFIAIYCLRFNKYICKIIVLGKKNIVRFPKMFCKMF